MTHPGPAREITIEPLKETDPVPEPQEIPYEPQEVPEKEPSAPEKVPA